MMHAEKAGFTLIKKEEAALLEKVLASVHSVGQTILSAEEDDGYDDGQETMHWFRSSGAPVKKKPEPVRANTMVNAAVSQPVKSMVKQDIQTPVAPSMNSTPLPGIELKREPAARQRLASPPRIEAAPQQTPAQVQPEPRSVSITGAVEAEVVQAGSMPEEPKMRDSASPTPTPQALPAETPIDEKPSSPSPEAPELAPLPAEPPVVEKPSSPEAPEPAPPVQKAAPKTNVAPQTPKKNIAPQTPKANVAPQNVAPQTPKANVAPQNVAPQTPKANVAHQRETQKQNNQITVPQQAPHGGEGNHDQDMRSGSSSPEVTDEKDQDTHADADRGQSPVQTLNNVQMVTGKDDVRDIPVQDTETAAAPVPSHVVTFADDLKAVDEHVTESLVIPDDPLADDHVVQSLVISEPDNHHVTAANLVAPNAGSAKKVLGLWMKKLERKDSIIEPHGIHKPAHAHGHAHAHAHAHKPEVKRQAMGTRLTAAINLLQIAHKLPRGTTAKSREEATTQTDDDDGVAAEGLRQLKSLLTCVCEFRREVIDEMFSVDDPDSEKVDDGPELQRRIDGVEKVADAGAIVQDVLKEVMEAIRRGWEQTGISNMAKVCVSCVCVCV
jgi:hypothetical protein